MRQIVIDELSPMERDNIDSYLKRSIKQGAMVGLYWLELPPDLLSEAQLGHEDHGPFYLGVEVDDQSVKFELLVRSQTNLHCTCIAHASNSQRQFVLNFIDRMVKEEMISS
ncbi:MAG: hypothetical protein BA862_07155 [Desulfobulbaceae bacterium S3730MH12]|nr:MAG: hypothetical protein BA866_13980 [Desulfobulbaceae bacterium S5133MH15]OEU57873.1 MAG: hypothetical protein BA862_07155 [Desulfobulbaceae bacterium S3730MH12]OEU79285.1 MAG: hypothetical protein BA873_04815 [Desulfobulbaceae bacterium C00003063]